MFQDCLQIFLFALNVFWPIVLPNLMRKRDNHNIAILTFLPSMVHIDLYKYIVIVDDMISRLHPIH